KKSFLVKVGGSVLTEAMLDSALAGDGRGNEARRQMYIQDWIDSEVLFQKALNDGLDRNPLVVGQLDNIRRELLIQFLLDLEMERSLTATTQEIEAYYEAHRDQYTYGEDQVKVEYFLTKDPAKVKTLGREFARMSRLRKKDFLEFVTPYAGENDIIGATEFSPRSHFEDRVARQIFLKNTTDEIIGSLPMKSGFESFWHVVEIRPKGKTIPVHEVSHEIEQRVRAVKRKELTEKLIKSLRQQAAIEYQPDEEAP
ncbi:MAG: hypothetical protein KDC45_08600, partial [Bacteroidetes bacterium]|nr:hypothetical protein [Bacteroidota bacterium]